MSVLQYMDIFSGMILDLLLQHLALFGLSLVGAAAIGVGLGIVLARDRRFAFLVPIANAVQSVPELVLLALAVPLIGVGFQAALLALFVKGVLPILRNTHSGIASVDPATVEAARGMGLSGFQILLQVELPLALPVILSGVRTASVMLVSVITLSAYIGVESLGVLIAQGIARMDPTALLVGSVMTGSLAVIINYGLIGLERVSTLWVK